MLDDVDFAKHLRTEKESAKKFQNSTDENLREYHQKDSVQHEKLILPSIFSARDKTTLPEMIKNTIFERFHKK